MLALCRAGIARSFVAAFAVMSSSAPSNAKEDAPESVASRSAGAVAMPTVRISSGRDVGIAGSSWRRVNVVRVAPLPEEDAQEAQTEGAPASRQAAIVSTGSINRMPLSGLLTSRFGNRRHPISGTMRRHAGIDIAASRGSPVQASGAGTVVSAGWAGGYGILVVVAHGNGLESRYAHLSQLAVASGQSVAEGQVVGYVGSTGRSTGPHLHYEVRRDGRALDPLGH